MSGADVADTETRQGIGPRVGVGQLPGLSSGLPSLLALRSLGPFFRLNAYEGGEGLSSLNSQSPSLSLAPLSMARKVTRGPWGCERTKKAPPPIRCDVTARSPTRRRGPAGRGGDRADLAGGLEGLEGDMDLSRLAVAAEGGMDLGHGHRAAGAEEARARYPRR